MIIKHDVVHKFPQVDLTEGEREKERTGEAKRETLTAND